MKKVSLRKQQELPEIYTDEIDNGLNYIVKLDKKEPYKSFILRWLGRGTAYNDLYYIWMNLFTDCMYLSSNPITNDRDKLFRTKKEAVEFMFDRDPKCNIVRFRDENEFIEYLKSV